MTEIIYNSEEEYQNSIADKHKYVLTEQDKEEIATLAVMNLEIPVVEKVIEKVQVIKEQPIVTEVTKVTNQIKEVAIPETPIEIRDKLEFLKEDERLDISAIKGFDKLKLIDQPILDRAIGILDSRTSFLINKVSNLSNSSSNSSGGSSTPGGSTTQLQYNNAGSFGGFGYTDGTNVALGNLGSETITNGSFATNANSWSLGAQFSYDATNHAALYTGNNSPSSLAQTFGSLQPFGWYYYSFDVSNKTGSGVITATVNIYDNIGTLISSTLNTGTNGTKTGYIYASSAQSIRYFFLTCQSNGVAATIDIDNISFKLISLPGSIYGKSANFDTISSISNLSGSNAIFSGTIDAGVFKQSNNVVIDTSTIGAQSVSHATTADLASAGADPFVIGNGTGNAQIQTFATAGAYTVQVDTTFTANGGMTIGTYDSAVGAGPNPMFGLSPNFTLYSGPLIASMLLGDIGNAWGTGGNFARMAYATDTNQLALYGYGSESFTFDFSQNTLIFNSIPSGPTGLGNAMFLTDAATAVTNNYNVVCMG